jgi:hypothetical protein
MLDEIDNNKWMIFKWMNFIPKFKKGNDPTYEMKKEIMNVWNKIY